MFSLRSQTNFAGMMPWDRDLEFVLMSTGPIRFLRACPHESGDERIDCIANRILTQVHEDIPKLQEMRPESQIEDTQQGATTHCAFEAQMHIWRHEPREIRLALYSGMDIDVIENVGEFEYPFRSYMFGDLPFRFSWDQWEQLFFDVFNLPAAKIFGSSGSYHIGKSLGCTGDPADQHNACLRPCNGKSGEFCELDDAFVHAAVPYPMF